MSRLKAMIGRIESRCADVVGRAKDIADAFLHWITFWKHSLWIFVALLGLLILAPPLLGLGLAKPEPCRGGRPINPPGNQMSVIVTTDTFVDGIRGGLSHLCFWDNTTRDYRGFGTGGPYDLVIVFYDTSTNKWSVDITDFDGPTHITAFFEHDLGEAPWGYYNQRDPIITFHTLTVWPSS